MKNLYLHLIAATLVAVISNSSQASTTATLTVSGTVAAVSDIEVTPNAANNTSLNITGGAAGTNVASVAETSNDAAGYKIQAYSTNSSELVNASAAAAKTAYQISYNGGAYVTLASSSAPVLMKSVSSLAQLTTANSNVLINVTAAPLAVAGIYQDVITFAIVAN